MFTEPVKVLRVYDYRMLGADRGLFVFTEHIARH